MRYSTCPSIPVPYTEPLYFIEPLKEPFNLAWAGAKATE